MSLITWLPLNGTIEDLGLDPANWTNNNATIDNNGKIGKCYSFTQTTGKGITSLDNGFMDKHINNRSFTLCAWIKSSSTDTVVLSLSCGLRFFAGTTPIVHLYNSSRTITASNPNSTADNNWHHVATTYNKDNGEVYVYVDGVPGTAAHYPSGSTYASSWNNGLYIGSDPNNTSVATAHYHFQGLMNDVRIYDECLSAKEIKEISKALILHYPMNEIDGVIGGRNLITLHGPVSPVTYNGITIEVSEDDEIHVFGTNTKKDVAWGHILQWCLNIPIEQNTNYTLSVTQPMSRGMYLQFNGVRTTNNNAFSMCRMSYPNMVSTGSSQDTKASVQGFFGFSSSANVVDCRFKIKFEKGSVATPWTPPWQSSIATLPSDTIYDASGCGYDGYVSPGGVVVDHTTSKKSAGYVSATYTPSSYLIPNKRYRCTICVTPAAGTQKYSFYLSNGWFNGADFPVSGTSKQIITKELTGGYYAGKGPEDNPKNANIQFYRFPNDGTVTGASTFHWCRVEEIGTCPDWSNDHVLGEGSYDFSTDKKIATPNNLPTAGLQNSYSFSWWAKGALIPNKMMWGFGNGNRLNYYNGLYCNTADGSANPFRTASGAIIPIPSVTEWHHYCMTGDGTATKLYLDGALYGTAQSYTPVTGSQIYINGWAENSEQQYNFNGLINDFRIYATALSPEDIKELYQTRYSIADNGTLFCDSIKEDTDLTNLVLNGGLKYVNGTEAKGFTNSYNSTYGGIRGAYDGFGCQTLIPLKPGCTYKYSFDYYIVSWNVTNSFYMAIKAYDNNNVRILDNEVERVGRGGDTTLAAPLNNGDTIATIVVNDTINAVWNANAVHAYSHLSAFQNLAWRYNRATEVGPKITGYLDGAVTLTSAWDKGTMPAGTKVGITRDSGTYIYPERLTSPQNYIGEWRTISGTFTTDSRYSMSYAQPHSLNRGQEVYFKNIRIENITETQLLNVDNCREANLSDAVKFPANGQLSAIGIYENEGLDIRYIRDYLNGSTANAANHWVEIQAFNDVGNNCCWGLTPTSSAPFQSIRPGGLITDGNTDSSPYAGIGGPGEKYVQLDLKKVRNIKQLKIWHYYYDGRQYNNKTQVSTDGTNWITVFDSDVEGKYVETVDGHIIDLTDKKFKIYSNGAIYANEYIEH